jgi:hypothetical protein
MSLAMIDGIPKSCNLRVEALPDRDLIWKGRVSGSWSWDLDPGKYTWKYHKIIGKRRTINKSGTFLHQITEENWKKLQNISPKTARFRITTEGAKYFCGLTGCDYDSTSRVSMVMHELEHQGRTLEDAFEEYEDEGELQEAVNEGAGKATRKRGRPRKNS